jgi:2-oxoglutarate dehydrogenase complex dehydrogenase (E1) component-like enzyme
MAAVKQFKNAEVVWVQEEHMNQGCWTYAKPRIDALLNYAGMSDKAHTSYVGRSPSAASATGHYKVHEKELEEFLILAFQ